MVDETGDIGLAHGIYNEPAKEMEVGFKNLPLIFSSEWQVRIKLLESHCLC